METKTQILRLINNNSQEHLTLLYCPFTGTVIFNNNNQDDILESEYPKTVSAIWSTEFADWDEPYFVSNNFNFDLNRFKEIEDIDQLSKLIDLLSNKEHYLLIDYSTYGSIPGDFGRIVFLLHIPS